MLIEHPRIPVQELLFFGFLPGFLKKFLYRLRGYRIGRAVSLGFGSVICGRNVQIGDHVKIGFFTIVRGKNIRMDSFVSIGSLSFLDTPNIEIGEGSKINEQVFVGGLQFPDSKFVMGRNCQIMQMCFLNPARSIVIGDDSGIGGDSLLFGHNSWLSRFEGYPVEFAPIEIGKSVSLAWRVFVLAGTKIGDGSVVGANSLVHRTIPPKSLAIGFPARVVKQDPEYPESLTDTEKLAIFRGIVDEMLQYFHGHGLECTVADTVHTVRSRKRTPWGSRRTLSWRFKAYDAPLAAEATLPQEDGLHLVVSLRAIPPGLRRRLGTAGVMWLDIETKERSLASNELGEEVALFFRRYGVRFIRVGERDTEKKA